MKFPFVIIKRRTLESLKSQLKTTELQLAGVCVIVEWMKQQERKKQEREKINSSEVY